MRIPILDGFRGFFLIFMMVVHANMPLDVSIGKINHHYLGWVEDAQGFVFISGFVVGLVYGGLYIRSTFRKMSAAIRARIGVIFSYHAALVLGFAAAALAFTLVGIVPQVLEPYAASPLLTTGLSLSLVAGTMHMGILPLYIWFMFVTPFVLWAIHKGHAPTVMTISIGLWLFAQTGLVDLGLAAIESGLNEDGASVPLGIFFSVFGWQVVFFGGLYLGYLRAAGRLDLDVLRDPAIRPAALFALLCVVLLAIYDRIILDQWISVPFSDAILGATDRGNFSVIYLVAFFLDLFLVAWLVVAGGTCGISKVEALSRWTVWFFTRPALVLLGQHSLQVFAWHIGVVYMLMIALDGQRLGEVQGSLVLLGCVATLYIPALLHARWLARKRIMTGRSTEETERRAEAPSTSMLFR